MRSYGSIKSTLTTGWKKFRGEKSTGKTRNQRRVSIRNKIYQRKLIKGDTWFKRS